VARYVVLSRGFILSTQHRVMETTAMRRMGHVRLTVIVTQQRADCSRS
jgi:hypothetical protein